MPAPQIRIPQNQVDAAARRGEPGLILRQDLDRYAYALAEARSELRSQFDGAELKVLATCLNGINHAEPRTARLLYAEIEDGLRNADCPAGKDSAALVTKLRALSITHCFALIDAVERFWNTPGADPAELLKQGIDTGRVIL